MAPSIRVGRVDAETARVECRPHLVSLRRLRKPRDAYIINSTLTLFRPILLTFFLDSRFSAFYASIPEQGLTARMMDHPDSKIALRASQAGESPVYQDVSS